MTLRSLPHRQLRKVNRSKSFLEGRSLPHRQLRNLDFPNDIYVSGSLPHRQLRNSRDLIELVV